MKKRRSKIVKFDPDDYDTPDCTDCKKKAVYKIVGGANCGYCGNEIPLCRHHLVVLGVEIGTNVFEKYIFKNQN